jgi:thiamine-monophosphate kinase
MAGTPTAALVTIGLPGTFSPELVEAIYAGLNALARRHQVAVVGGETTTNPGGIFLSVALLGWVPRGKGVLRSGAEVGDAIFVTGELGGSLAGKHLDFEPRLAEARWLAQHFSLHAMLDISDGLAGDLPHLLKASRVGAELLATTIPISREARRAAKMLHAGRTAGLRASSGAATSSSSGASEPSSAPVGPVPAAPEDGRTPGQPPPAELPARIAPAKPPLLAALTDGEDFELLFTVASRDAVPLLDAWKKQFPGLALTCIGKIKAGEGITIRDKQGVRPLTAHGYVHFA